jgi:hypothetical protein
MQLNRSRDRNDGLEATTPTQMNRDWAEMMMAMDREKLNSGGTGQWAGTSETIDEVVRIDVATASAGDAGCGIGACISEGGGEAGVGLSESRNNGNNGLEQMVLELENNLRTQCELHNQLKQNVAAKLAVLIRAQHTEQELLQRSMKSREQKMTSELQAKDRIIAELVAKNERLYQSIRAKEGSFAEQQDGAALAFKQVRESMRVRAVRSCTCRWRRGILTRAWAMWNGQLQRVQQTRRDSATLQAIEQQQQRDIMWRDSIQNMQEEWGKIEHALQSALAAQKHAREIALVKLVQKRFSAQLHRQWNRLRLNCSHRPVAAVELTSRKRQVGMTLLLHALFSNRCRQFLRHWRHWRGSKHVDAYEPLRDMQMLLVPYAPVCLICSGIWDRWNNLLGDVLPLDRTCCYLYQGIQLGQIAPDAVSAAQSVSRSTTGRR